MATTGEWSYDRYREGTAPLPRPNLAWNTYGEGVESIGRDGRPEPVDIPAPAPDQLLVRVDAVGLCFSDVKLIRLGSEHPKLYGRDLSADPIRLGHEATVTVIEVGDDLAGNYRTGDRLAIQPDIFIDGRSTAYGYTIPGGLIQYHLIGPEILAANGVSYVIPVADGIGYAAAALSEPWACVEAAYTQRRRLWPRSGGTAWVVGRPDDRHSYDFGETLRDAARIVLTGLSPSAADAVLDAIGPQTETSVVNAMQLTEYASLVERETGGEGFDDIVLLDPDSAAQVTEIARHIAFRGTLNLVGERPLDGPSSIDFGRLHYDYTAFFGTSGPNIAHSYGEQRNRCDLRPGGLAVFVGAGGPMGQMHVQRALEKADGPSVVIGIDPDQERLDVLQASFGPVAERSGTELIVLNADVSAPSVRELVDQHSDGAGADDVIVTVPVAAVMASAAQLMSADGMLVFFAGVANGTTGPLDMSAVYLGNAQYTGTSGSTLDDQALVLDKTAQGSLSPDLNLAAVGGIEAGRDGVQAMLDGRFAGKIVIFPQVSGMPLLGLDELSDKYPEIGSALGPQGQWTAEAERRLIEAYGVVEDP
ncbi:MAG: alcohol dehydrogenase catalytic domain-containing protein [Acidimicrobiales bacterium]|nr:alcohol dehydrogenase catalytic domain-containing protein [Acidimicrobiales bacterium]MXX42559.1 alcohol dehydrogenase catalytic domain-containing protein [Acidimicrobiales bacterium]MXZ13937.1 alcohol dehydrogenase catalytic domain-containing protein [Acidimicrobiales bacterium]MYB82762.1 alcohol dehydrogenase catalytic domain-containing protein [Acidimicrobiales bacterium]MYD34034.1 alcohol dehydrogenase catalytic domain-containing protein [Acidimicrobiales bacterium]